MRLVVWVIALAGCGRIGFDDHGGAAFDATLDGLTGHDEDGDGTPDAFDNCPGKAGPQTDTDGDGVGDICDWQPTIPRQSVVLFATMQPGDQPFADGDELAVQLADAVRISTVNDALYYAHAFGDVSIEFGIDIEAIQGGAKQHQIAFDATNASLPDDFMEINEVPGTFQEASITEATGTAYNSLANQFLATGIHTGSLVMTTVQTVGGTDVLDVILDAEHYHVEHEGSPYDGGTTIAFNVNNLTIAVRYAFVVAGN